MKKLLLLSFAFLFSANFYAQDTATKSKKVTIEKVTTSKAGAKEKALK